MINFYEKHCFPVITWNKKYSSKQVVAEVNTLEGKVFASAGFKDFWLISFSDKVKKATK